jgi:[ribosomal protein S5]-alanine N-acetyltransferase
MFTELALPQSNGRLRRYTHADLDALVRHADNPKVAHWLVDAFPQPYTRAHGEAFIQRILNERDEAHFAIEIEGEYAGELSYRPGQHERRIVAGFGYWLAEPYWGRGIMSEAVRVSSDHLLQHLGFTRLQTDVYAPNIASQRVLQKAGFTLESVRRQSVIKRGEVLDCPHYVKLRQS